MDRRPIGHLGLPGAEQPFEFVERGRVGGDDPRLRDPPRVALAHPQPGESRLQRLVARLLPEAHHPRHPGQRFGDDLDVTHLDLQRRLGVPAPPGPDRLDDRVAAGERSATFDEFGVRRPLVSEGRKVSLIEGLRVGGRRLLHGINGGWLGDGLRLHDARSHHHNPC